MTKVLVGFLRSPEGRAALTHAIAEADLHGAELVVVHTARDDAREIREDKQALEELEQRLSTGSLRYSIRDCTRGNSPAEDLVQAARDEDADLPVIGGRRRSPVGKLVLGSNAQQILLTADCPVLAVKAAGDDE